MSSIGGANWWVKVCSGSLGMTSSSLTSPGWPSARCVNENRELGTAHRFSQLRPQLELGEDLDLGILTELANEPSGRLPPHAVISTQRIPVPDNQARA